MINGDVAIFPNIVAVKGKKEITHDDGPRRLLGRRFCRSQGGDGRGKRLGRGGGKHSSLIDVCVRVL